MADTIPVVYRLTDANRRALRSAPLVRTLGALVLPFVALFVGCGTSSDEPIEVRSDDGAVTLTIPADAMPKGLAASAIHVIAVKAQDTTVKASDGAPLRSFRFEPAGTQFRTPVTFALTLPISDGAGLAPLLMHSSGDALETQLVPIEGVRVERDVAAGSIRVTAEISHFSSIDVDTGGLFVTETSPPRGEFALGQSFEWTMTIRAQQRHYVRQGDFLNPAVDMVVSVANGTTFEVSPEGPLGTQGNLEPKQSTLLKESVRVETGYRAAQRLTCAKAGPDYAVVHGRVIVTFTLQTESRRPADVGRDGYVYRKAGVVVSREERITEANAHSTSYNCLAAKPIELGPITAAASALTVYTLDTSRLPADEAPTFTWSGATCGKAVPEGNRYSWDHREAVAGITGGLGTRELGRAGDCDHRADSSHGNPLIVVEVAGKTFTAPRAP